MSKVALIWFRNDLRLSDNMAVAWAVKHGYEILPFVHYEAESDIWALGGASKWWLYHALEDFQQQVNALGGSVIYGDSQNSDFSSLDAVIAQNQVEAVLWNRLYEPESIKRDTFIKERLKAKGLHVQSFNSNILFDPVKVRNKSGSPFKVFTPFWKALREVDIPMSTDVDLNTVQWKKTDQQEGIKAYDLLPKIPWDQGFTEYWNPTRGGALECLNKFVPTNAELYPDNRDRPDLEGTSRLSPYLHFGQIGPRETLQALRALQSPVVEDGIVRQLFWREFANHLLYHFPHSPTQPLYEKYKLFPWDEDEALLKAWQKGQTGYPIVDAAMRELWHTGWMHNRARMIVGSVLVKHLLQPWQAGAAWFWDTLVDANLANNTMGWQWIAGSGADGAPYFRVFNPITQGQKFDKTGDYVRKWCPELANLPNKYLHCPFDAPPLELVAAGVTLGKTYPHPIVDHATGRQRALDAFATFKERSTNL